MGGFIDNISKDIYSGERGLSSPLSETATVFKEESVGEQGFEQPNEAQGGKNLYYYSR